MIQKIIIIDYAHENIEYRYTLKIYWKLSSKYSYNSMCSYSKRIHRNFSIFCSIHKIDDYNVKREKSLVIVSKYNAQLKNFVNFPDNFIALVFTNQSIFHIKIG